MYRLRRRFWSCGSSVRDCHWRDVGRAEVNPHLRVRMTVFLPLPRIISLPMTSRQLYLAAIALEQQQQQQQQQQREGAGGLGDKGRITALFEGAVGAFGSTDAELWLEFCRHALQVVKPCHTSAVLSRTALNCTIPQSAALPVPY